MLLRVVRTTLSSIFWISELEACGPYSSENLHRHNIIQLSELVCPDSYRWHCAQLSAATRYELTCVLGAKTLTGSTHKRVASEIPLFSTLKTTLE